jgi:hypothetical protein
MGVVARLGTGREGYLEAWRQVRGGPSSIRAPRVVEARRRCVRGTGKEKPCRADVGDVANPSVVAGREGRTRVLNPDRSSCRKTSVSYGGPVTQFVGRLGWLKAPLKTGVDVQIVGPTRGGSRYPRPTMRAAVRTSNPAVAALSTPRVTMRPLEHIRADQSGEALPRA